jgi:cell division protein FtsL
MQLAIASFCIRLQKKGAKTGQIPAHLIFYKGKPMQTDVNSEIESLSNKIKAGEKEVEDLKAAFKEAVSLVKDWKASLKRLQKKSKGAK